MTPLQAVLAFALAAGLLTVTPGLDTALVLRTATVDGPRRAVFATLGINLGLLTWGAAVALGLAAVFAASAMAFTVLKWAGAAYLVWLGLNMVLRPRDRFEAPAGRMRPGSDLASLRQGYLTNILNPKVGVFYVSFLPQFLPHGVAPAPFIFALAVMHAILNQGWFGILTAATRSIAGVLRRAAVVRALDRLTGGVFLAFGVRLALERT